MNGMNSKHDDAHYKETSKRKNMLRYVVEDAPSKLSHFIKAYKGLSLRSGVTAKCLHCLGCETIAIRECKDTACPLWEYRPYQVARK